MGFLLNLLFPRKCILCQCVLHRDEEHLCTVCLRGSQPREKTRQKLRFLKKWYALWNYENQVRDSIHRYKFSDRQSYAAGYAACMGDELAGKWDADLLTWVPLSARRKHTRGYDQCEDLAVHLSGELTMPVAETLVKTVDNPAQSSISGAAQRRANVLGVYQVVDSDLVTGKRILLVDDVITTGATASECARVLLTAGAKEVYLVTVAAVPRLK